MKSLITLFLMIGCAQLFGQVTIDFTDPGTPTYGTNAQKIENVDGEDKAMMWAGDVNGDGDVRRAIDESTIDATILLAPGNTGFLSGFIIEDTYDPADIDLDGRVIRTVDVSLLNQHILLHPANTGFLSGFIIIQQLP